MKAAKCLIIGHLFSILLLVPWHAQSESCIDLYAQKLEIVNTNARISAHDYSRPNARSLVGYRDFLGSAFQKFFTSVKPNAVWIDSGGGYGVAGLQAVMKKGMKVYVINAQDFWQYAEQSRPSLDLIKTLTSDLDVSTDGVPVVRETMGTTSSLTWKNVLSQHFNLLAERIIDKVKALKQSGFHYKVGFSETQIPRIQESADLVTDLYGAFFYSADRSGLLDLYYNHLSENGIALIRTGFKDRGGGFKPRVAGGGIKDTVLLPDGRKVDLIDFLIGRFPNIFSRDTEDSKVLVVRRNPDLKFLNLSDIIKPTTHQMTDQGGVDYPVVQWELVSQAKP